MKKLLMIVTIILMSFFIVLPTVSAAAVYDHEVSFDLNGGEYVHGDLQTLGNKLNTGTMPVVINCEGDSTSDATTEWFYMGMDLLGAEVPDYTMQYRYWNAATSSYIVNQPIQYGIEGDAYALYDGTVGDVVYAQDSTALSIVGDLQLTAKINIVAGNAGDVVTKWGVSGDYSYILRYSIDAPGTGMTVTTMWSEDGTAIIAEQAASTVVSVGQDIWIRTTIDVDDLAGNYVVDWLTSTDGITFTSYHTHTNAAGPTSIYDSTAAVIIGDRYHGGTDGFQGRLYEAEIRAGVGAGAVVASPNFDNAFPASINSFKDPEGNVWTIMGDVSVGNGSPGITVLNGSISGSTTETFTASVLNAQLEMDSDMIFINLSHNEDVNDAYVAEIENFVTANKTRQPLAGIVLVAQNEHINPRTVAQIAAQGIRVDQVKLVAAREKYVIMDAFAALHVDTVTYISADGLHPSAAGYTVEANLLCDMLMSGIDGIGGDFQLLVEHGEEIVEPDEPTKSGFTFTGWYTDEECEDEWIFGTDTVLDDMVLYAGWSDGSVPVIPSILNLGSSMLSVGVMAGSVFLVMFFINRSKRNRRH